MIEAMACGTPVIAWGNGAVPEVVDHGVTGFIVDSVAEAAEAVDQVNAINRRRVRHVFEQRFSAATMAKRYLEIYARIVGTAGSEETALETA
jgi:glycosyltransferase involved in cell wall biosynthesis